MSLTGNGGPLVSHEHIQRTGWSSPPGTLAPFRLLKQRGAGGFPQPTRRPLARASREIPRGNASRLLGVRGAGTGPWLLRPPRFPARSELREDSIWGSLPLAWQTPENAASTGASDRSPHQPEPAPHPHPKSGPKQWGGVKALGFLTPQCWNPASGGGRRAQAFGGGLGT